MARAELACPADRRLSTIGLEAGGYPQAEGPLGRQCRVSDQASVAAYHLQGSGASDHIIVKPRVRIDDAEYRAVRGGHVEPNGCAAVDGESITPRANKKRHGLHRPPR